MINLTIDGKQLQVAEGTTVLRAAESAGINIPTLCDHPQLTPYGGCRLCLVEVEGVRTLQPSCTLPVTQNMVVRTDTEKVKEARKFVLTLIFSERNHFCMYCQVSGGDCELQNSAYAEGMTHWPLQPNYSPFTVDASNPFFVIDNNRCILCRRCVRACGELVGNYTLGIEERGANSYLVADLGNPIGESSCVSCGTCIQVCPTGAIIDRQSAYNGREKDTTKIKSICTGCSIGCGIEVLTRDNRVVRIDGDWEAKVNNGLLCQKGRFDPLANDSERVATTLIRNASGLKASTYEAGVTAAVELIKSTEKDTSPAAALISAEASVEAMDAFVKLFKGLKNYKLGTIDGEGYVNSIQAVKSAGKEVTLAQAALADCVIVLGSDLMDDHQVAGFMVKRNLPGGTKLIVLDGNSSRLAPFADIVLEPAAGNFGKLADTLASKSDDKLTALVNYAQSISVIIGCTRKSDLDELANGLKRFAQSAEKAGKSFGIVTLKGKANTLYASTLGLDAHMDLKGVKTAIIFQQEEKIAQKQLQQFEMVPNLIVHSSFVSGLTARSQVVFPAATWAESEGSYINVDGTRQVLNKIINPARDVHNTVDLIHGIEKNLGVAK